MDIPGLTYVATFLSATQHAWLVAKVDSLPWSNALKRRTQHYGWTYRYDRRPMTHAADYLGALPDWLLRVASHLTPYLGDVPPDQVIGNEYTPGQGIGRHTDHTRNFADGIATVSLLAPAVMEFQRGSTVVPVTLEPGSLCVMTEAARFDWTHRIAAVSERRISLTFRRVSAAVLATAAPGA